VNPKKAANLGLAPRKAKKSGTSANHAKKAVGGVSVFSKKLGKERKTRQALKAQ